MASIFSGEVETLQDVTPETVNVYSRWDTGATQPYFYQCVDAEKNQIKTTAQCPFSELIMQYVLPIYLVNFWERNNFCGYNLFLVCSSAYLIGKIFMYMFVANLGGDIAFAVVYIYSAELFPTTVR